MPADLAGLRVMVTRPAHQAQHLVELIEGAGGQPFVYPLLAINPAEQTTSLQKILQQIDRYEILIFVSPNAVEFGLPLLDEYGGIPAQAQLACVGDGTRRHLQQKLHRRPDICPSHQFNSEGLLAMPALQDVQDMSILILRGQQGRELLAETLRERGAQVDYAEVYQRQIPDLDNKPLRDALQSHAIDIISITSGEALENLLQLAADTKQLALQLPLVVINTRLAEQARALGFNNTLLVTSEVSDAAILDCLHDWYTQEKQEHTE